MRAPLLALLLLAAPLAGCTGGSVTHDGEVDGSETTKGDIRVEGGRLKVPDGSRYEMQGGTLRLSNDPRVVVDGELEVRGDVVLRGVTLVGLFRVAVYPTGSLVMEDVVVRAGVVAPTFILVGREHRITRGDMDVHSILVRTSATIEGVTIRSATLAPAVMVRGGTLLLTDSDITAAGYGVVADRANATLKGNTISAGTNQTVGAIVARGGGSLVAEGNTLAGGAGIAVDGAAVHAVGNTVKNATAGIAVLSSPSVKLERNVVEHAERAGLLVQKAGSAVVEGNVVRSAGSGRWPGTLETLALAGAGIAVDGAVTVRGNDLLGADIGIAILGGAPTLRANNLEGNRHFGILRNVTASSSPLDVSGNWWGSPSGPLPAAPTGPALPAAPGTQKVGPGLTYAPWLVQRRG